MTQSFIPLSVPTLNGNELTYVTKAIEDEWVSTAGPYIKDFENEIKDYVNTGGAVAVQNGTSGIHIALKLLGVTEEDEVIAPTLTFIAAINPISYCGASPIFMDCDDSLGMDADKLRNFLENECFVKNGKIINKKTSKVIRAIIVVHVFGNMADMESIMELADEYKLPVIEDATEAIGTYYTSGYLKGKYAGTIGTIGIYSFNGNKIMTTGGGGMIVSNNNELLEKARYLTTQAKSDNLFYRHDEIGYNYRMTNLQAALGLAQFEQLETFIDTKKRNYHLYKSELESIEGLSLIDFRDNTRPNYWFYGLKLSDAYQLGRKELIKRLADQNIQARPIWDLIHDQLPYKNMQSHQIDKAYHYLSSIINLPCSSNLTSQEVNRVLNVLG
ncbi:aminotransferase family protein [Gracilibacillus halophilus YIM-C55.5]|uniref:Aminotransferase family protein n=1 Tax=Gracilibacillus halophilus YIM-C55.5 TaxID=1308866 RepID=N4WUV5_9BACI|nr:LegC family aminotransferase [Gracilibacillus halophilus]ENH98110.1 aminotransferase family protein [Gracilibacillus halophilus YIM-C55.5]